MATPEQLRKRWNTEEGKKVKEKIIAHICDPDWGKYLIGFPYSSEIKNNKDLRYIDFSFEGFTEATMKCVKEEGKIIGPNFSNADLTGANFFHALLISTNFKEATIKNVDFLDSTTMRSNFENSIIIDSQFVGADLWGSNFRFSKIENSDFYGSNLTNVDLSNTNMNNCKIYGISAWGIKRNECTKTRNLIISPINSKDALIIVDDIELAQFIYLILDNEKISNLITTMRTKGVLILGSFSEEEKKTLDFIKQIISKNKKGYIPIVFDFDPPKLQSLIDTIEVLSLLSRFIIVDLTRSAGQLIELSLFDKLRIPYAMIISNKAKHVPANIEKYIISEWCYKEELVIYSDKSKEDELNELINNGIAIWAEEINEKYEKDIIGSRKRLKELNSILHKKN